MSLLIHDATVVTVDSARRVMFADYFEVVRLCMLVARIRGRDALTMTSGAC
ncbi:MAG TPA: hypothetical protein VJB36_12855 [Methylomirabilota bacterium]|nr:hypothetical protein [Methylomirabilota bacterium]